MVLMVASLWLIGAGCSSEESEVATLASWAERDSRRAYAGAPPVIPHPPLTGKCADCHTPEGGRVIPEVGIAPANPHTLTAGMSAESRCRQCHVFQQSEALFVDSDFSGLHFDVHTGDRATTSSPPTVPHTAFMREDCSACHCGPAARPEIVCNHADRVRCQQCHVQGYDPVELTLGIDAVELGSD